jgi:hypothetical protein
MSRTLRLLLWSAASLVAAALWTTAVTLGQTGGLRGTQMVALDAKTGVPAAGFGALWRDHPVSTDVNDAVERSFNAPKRPEAGRGL